MSRVFFLQILFYAAGTWGASDPLTLKPVADTYLSADYAGVAKGRGKRDELQIYSKAKHLQFRALLRFDLDQIKRPPGRAVLRVHGWNILRPKKGTELIRCHAVVRPWSEALATWDVSRKGEEWANLGGDWDPVAVAGCNLTTTLGGQKGHWFHFDVTRLVQEWIMKRRPNYGLVIMLGSDLTGEIRLRSREAGQNQPELVLGWNRPVPTGEGMVPGHKISPYGKKVKLEPTWNMSSLNQVKVGVPFKMTLKVRGGVTPYTFSAKGLPEGVSLSKEGELSGTASKVGRFPIGFVCAGADKKSSNQRMTLVVVDAAAKVVGGKKPSTEQPPQKKKKREVEEEE